MCGARRGAWPGARPPCARPTGACAGPACSLAGERARRGLACAQAAQAGGRQGLRRHRVTRARLLRVCRQAHSPAVRPAASAPLGAAGVTALRCRLSCGRAAGFRCSEECAKLSSADAEELPSNLTCPPQGEAGCCAHPACQGWARHGQPALFWRAERGPMPCTQAVGRAGAQKITGTWQSRAVQGLSHTQMSVLGLPPACSGARWACTSPPMPLGTRSRSSGSLQSRCSSDCSPAAALQGAAGRCAALHGCPASGPACRSCKRWRWDLPGTSSCQSRAHTCGTGRLRACASPGAGVCPSRPALSGRSRAGRPAAPCTSGAGQL